VSRIIELFENGDPLGQRYGFYGTKQAFFQKIFVIQKLFVLYKFKLETS